MSGCLSRRGIISQITKATYEREKKIFSSLLTGATIIHTNRFCISMFLRMGNMSIRWRRPGAVQSRPRSRLHGTRSCVDMSVPVMCRHVWLAGQSVLELYKTTGTVAKERCWV